MAWLGVGSRTGVRRLVICGCGLLGGCGDAGVAQVGSAASSSGSGDTDAGNATEASSSDQDSSDESGSSTGDGSEERVDPFEGARLVRGGAPFGARAFGDFDGDGDDDIAISYQAELVQQSVVGIYGYNPETDAFDFIMQPEYGRIAGGLVPGHVDGNDQLDLIATWAGYGIHSSAQLALMGAEIEAGPAVDLPGFRLGLPVDFDGDHRSEQLEVRGNDIVLHEVDLAGGWEVQQRFEGAPGCAPSGAAWANLDDDTALEVGVVSVCDGGGGLLTTYEHEQGGLLRELRSVRLDIPAREAYFADFDDDGVIDVLVSSSNYTGLEDPPQGQVRRGTESGSFDEVLLDIAPPDVEYGSIRALTADIDGDGMPEAFPKNWGSALEGVGVLDTVMLTLGPELRVDVVPFDEGFSRAADINGDGCEDLVAGSLTTLLMACE